MPKAKRLSKSWDDYVAEATRPPLELELPGSEVILINQPTGEDAMAINTGLRLNDPSVVAPALFGESGGPKVMELYRKAPGPVFMSLAADIFREFNLSPAAMDAEEQSGDSDASST